jgi:hypothetical protein
MSDDSLELLAIPTNQQARQDLVAVGEAVELEKDRLLNVVRSFFARKQSSTIRTYNPHRFPFSFWNLDKKYVKRFERLGIGPIT